MEKLKVEKARTADLVPYAHNAKQHDDKQVEQIAASIEQFGFNDPVAVWTRPDGLLEIVAGHGRIMAAKLLGMEYVPIIRLDHLDDDGRRAYTHVHNQTTLSSGFDMDALDLDLADIPGFDWGDFGFGTGDWFTDRERFSSGKQEGNAEYNEWLDKFEEKRTTDDCYTPNEIYEAIAEWVAAEYDLDRADFVRPFYPGGDYQSENYPKGCVVVDNPPFSILAEIIRFYEAAGVRFFLFAPMLTMFSTRDIDVCFVPVNCDITYENGATVATSFITNLDEENIVRTAPDLCRIVNETNGRLCGEDGKQAVLKYEYPPYVLTAAMLGNLSKHGAELRIRKGAAAQIAALDVQKEHGKAIYGTGLLLSEKAKDDAEAAKAAAERAKAAEAAKALEAAQALGDDVEVRPDGSIVWKLSERELEIVRTLKP